MKNMTVDIENNKKIYNIPRIMIAGTNSGCGKTTVMCALLSAFKQMNKKVSAFKCGPDYIDPMFYEKILGFSAGNLDLFFSKPEECNRLLCDNTKADEVAFIEGVMGLYDGISMEEITASSYDLAKNTDTPIILVVNAKQMAHSVIPLIKGFVDYQSKPLIKGVILNKITEPTYRMLKPVIENEINIKVLGYFLEDKKNELESRHLGLVMPEEYENIYDIIRELGKKAIECIDLQGIEDLLNTAPTISIQTQKIINENKIEKKVVAAIARDAAFCFYYRENIKILEKLGVSLVEFSPLKDTKVPENANMLILGGGYPENHASELEANVSMRESIKTFINNGGFCIAECGGFMYLCNTMEDTKKVRHEMAGVLDNYAIKKDKLVRFGYVELTSNISNQYLPEHESIKGHEFHYWDTNDNGNSLLATKPSKKRSWECMHITDNIIAGFPHLYYASNIKFIERFIEECRKKI